MVLLLVVITAAYVGVAVLAGDIAEGKGYGFWDGRQNPLPRADSGPRLRSMVRHSAGLGVLIGMVVLLMPGTSVHAGASLDCGTDEAGAEAAFHEFASILRAGDRPGVRAALEDKGEFFQLFASAKRPNGGSRTLIYERRPGGAAAEVSRQGGLPITITRFTDGAGEPDDETGSGTLRGTWGDRKFVGKSALDCVEGKAIVLSLSVGKPQ